MHATGTIRLLAFQRIVIEDSVADTQADRAAGMLVFDYHRDLHSDRDGLVASSAMLFDGMRKLAGLIPIA